MGKRDSVDECEKMVTDLFKILGTQLPEFLRDTIAQAKGLWQFAPFQVGDRVVLCDPPVITQEDSWGWMPHKHLFHEGALATVQSVEWLHYHRKPACFAILVTFDADASKGHFYLDANRFRINSEPSEVSLTSPIRIEL